MYNEVIYFATQVDSGEVDDYGDPVMEWETTLAYAKVASIGTNEFYQAMATGQKPEIKFIIPEYVEYDGQERVIYGDMVYKVLRTYRNSNKLEITCYGGIRDVSS